MKLSKDSLEEQLNKLREDWKHNIGRRSIIEIQARLLKNAIEERDKKTATASEAESILLK